MTYNDELKKLEHLKVDKKMWKESILDQTKTTHKEFYKKHKTWVRTLDIILIIVVILNYGALFITNALAIKANPDLQLMEANPVQAELNDLEEHPDGEDLMKAIVIQTLMWVAIISAYLLQRLYTYTHVQLWVTTVLMTFYAFIITLDFINNFGYLFGLWIWGS